MALSEANSPMFLSHAGNLPCLSKEEASFGDDHMTLKLVVSNIHHWPPFNDLQSGEASSPGYRHALEWQHATPDLPYGLEVWHGVKVLMVLWADDGRFDIATFARGSWEDLALAL
jgi:hypothetical protein